MCNRNKIEELWTTPMPLSPDQRLTESMPQCRCRPLAALRQGRSSGQFCGGRHIPLLAAHRENLWSWSLHRHQIHWRLHSGKTCGHGLRPDTRYNMKVSKGKMKTFDYYSIFSILSHVHVHVWAVLALHCTDKVSRFNFLNNNILRFLDKEDQDFTPSNYINCLTPNLTLTNKQNWEL